MKRKILFGIVAATFVAGGLIVLGSAGGDSMATITASVGQSKPSPGLTPAGGPEQGALQGAPAPAVAGKAGSQEGQSRADASGSAGQAQITDRMIVYNASISLGVESVPEAVNSVSALADGVGGFVAGTSLRYQEDKEYATLTLRVPSSAYNQVMSALRKMAVKVTNETGSARDVTEEFTDLAAQLRNYEATEAQYLELLRRANTIDEILKVQAKLTEVRGLIERTKGRMNLLQRTSDMATIAVNLAPAEAAKDKEPKPGWDPAKSVQEAWEQSLVLVRAFADAGIRVLVFSWWLAPPALLAWAVWATACRPQRLPASPAGGSAGA